MGSAALLVFAAIAGYLFTEKSYRYKYFAAREGGQRFYLRSILVGIPFVAFSAIISHILFYIPLFNPSYSLVHLTEAESILSIGVGAVLASMLGIYIYNSLVGDKGKADKFREAMSSNDYDLILYDSMDNLHPIAVVLENRKVYVGIIYDGLEPSSSSSYLTLVPLYSGYRESETLHLTIQNSYIPVQEAFITMWEQRKAHADPFSDDAKKDAREYLSVCNDYKLAMPREKIINMYKFNRKLYDQVQGEAE